MDSGWRRVLSNIGKGFLVTSATLALAIVAAPLVSEHMNFTNENIRYFRLFALGLVAWGVIGKSGWEIQSWKGKNPWERFNSCWWLFLYFSGLFIGALGVLVVPAK